MAAPVEAALRRQRALTLAALVVLTLLAWGWLIAGAGMGMAAQAWLPFSPRAAVPGSMTGMDGMTEMAGLAAPGRVAWSTGQLLLAVAMWWVMMVAMMRPAAAPTILLYARAAPGQSVAVRPAPGHFLAGYLAVWGAFSLAAAGLQDALQQAGAVAPTTMDSTVRWLSAALLVAAGAYQLSPLKNACLAKCRSPAAFLSRHYRPGRSGALRMGAIHGAFCLGCCWLLMALLFVGGVMNLAWVAFLALLVAGEKLLPGGRRLGQAAGVALIAWGALVAFS
jgi:predicted metal-binding membrane protein